MSEPLLSKREAESFYSKATRDFDKWFFSLPKEQQTTLRESGVKPYAELKCRHYVIEFDPEHNNGDTPLPWDEPTPDNSETFYSRDKVQEIVRRLLDAIGYSLDPRVRLHFLLIKLALRMPDAVDGKRVARLFGITKAGVSFRVQRIREILQNGGETQQNAGKKGHATPVKESPGHVGTSRVASHRGQKTRVSWGKPRGARK